MKRIVAVMVLLLAGTAAATSAQKHPVMGWSISDPKSSVLKRIEGIFLNDATSLGETVLRTADEGSIVMVRATFSYVDDAFKVPKIDKDNIQITGRTIGNRPTVEVAESDIQLSGYEGKKQVWSFEPIAVAIDNANGCNPYWFLDSKDTTRMNGFGAGGGHISIENKSFKLISPMTLCLAFPAPTSRHEMQLQFGGVKVKLR